MSRLVWRAGPEGNVEFAAQLQATLNVIPAYTWYAAPSGGLTFVNKRTADYLGLPKDHPLRFGIDIGAQWDAHIPLLHPDDREESRKAWSTCLRTGEAAEIEPARIVEVGQVAGALVGRAGPIGDPNGGEERRKGQSVWPGPRWRRTSMTQMSLGIKRGSRFRVSYGASYLSELNREHQAVVHGIGAFDDQGAPLLVIAGAGLGQDQNSGASSSHTLLSTAPILIAFSS